MRALVFRRNRNPEVEDVADPTAGPGDVIIRVAAAGICHTDLDILHGRYPAELPRVPGHEFAGLIVAVGDDVSELRIGERVAVDPLLPCQSCRNCLRGNTNLCSAMKSYGAELDGGIAELVAVNARNAHPIGNLDWNIAALAEPVGCVVNAIERAGPRQDDRVVVIGAGPMGMLLGVVLHSVGLRDLTIVDLAEDRLKRAHEFGYSSAVLSHGKIVDELGARAFDIVIDATGRPEVVQAASGLLADGGTLIPFGVCPPGSSLTIDPNEVYARQLRIIGSFSLAAAIPRALKILRESSLDVRGLVTHEFPLSTAPAAMADVGSADGLKIQINPAQLETM